MPLMGLMDRLGVGPGTTISTKNRRWLEGLIRPRCADSGGSSGRTELYEIGKSQLKAPRKDLE